MFLGAAALVCGVGVYYHFAAGRGADVDVLAEAERRGELHASPPSPLPVRPAKSHAAGGRFEPIGPRPQDGVREPVAAGR